MILSMIFSYIFVLIFSLIYDIIALYKYNYTTLKTFEKERQRDASISNDKDKQRIGVVWGHWWLFQGVRIGLPFILVLYE